MKEEVRDVDELVALLGNSMFNGRMAVAQRVHADAAQQIEILLAMFIFEKDALATGEENRVPLVGREQELRLGRPNLLHGFALFHFFGLHAHATITSVPWGIRALHRSGSRPASAAGKMRTRLTPCSNASRQALSFGSMPPLITSSLVSAAI